MDDKTIQLTGITFAYLMLIIPLSIIYIFKLPLFKKMLIAVTRMTLQLLFVGLYLQVVFRLNNPFLNLLWLIIMITVADVSILRATDLKLRKLGRAIFAALSVGTALPLAVFATLVLSSPALFEARFMIPVGGMILGNCLRADIIGIGSFYKSLRKEEKSFLLSLSQGANLSEATSPFMADSLTSALSPTIATMSTIGLVSLPGMMTGVILAGANPITAIKYQLAIMMSIFTGTAITVVLAIKLTQKTAFIEYGVLDRNIFAS
ncbi:MAG: ABC transporter permease [Sedimentisphaeraceae bacterium JB056]